MNAIEFEITILRRSNECWPIVVRTRQLDGLTTHTEGSLQLTEDDWSKLRIEQENEKEYGKLLGQAVFRNEVRDAFIRAYSNSKSSQNCRLRILLSIEVDNTDELRTLHWHRLCAPIDADGAWNLLVRDQRVPFSLYIPTIIDRRFSPIGRRDLRALVLIANPSNLEKYRLTPFDDKDVLNKVKLALGGIPCKFLANINNEDVIGPPTLEELSKQITDASAAYTIIHIVCHGMLIKDGDRDTVLYWATKDNQVQTVRGTQLVQELKNIGERRGLPHLAFLCTCESAPPEAERALGGLGQQLVRHLGMPAVVAMTRKVSVTTALALGERFYQRLGEHGEVDLALQEATAGLGDRHDITVPALFSRLGGRPLFSDRLEGRELSEAEIEDGIEEFGKLIEERAPHASALKKEFEEQAKKLKYLRGSEIPSAKPQRQDALCKLNILCNQVLEIGFDALTALGKKPPEYEAECPFPGLSSFKEEKYHKFFFGRDELIKELHQKLKEDNFLAVLGDSGSGKSSVVLAGLIPKLQQEKPDLQMVYLRPGSEPLEQLHVSQAKASGQPTVFVVDQFEELFTLCSDESQRRGFIDQLLQLAEHQNVTITMRSDFLGECTRYSALRERMEKRQKLIGAMEPTELGIAMKRQADAPRLEFEEGLSNAILAEVEQEPGRMPLLQYALQQLWERRWGRWLCYEEYEEIGGVQKAIATTADAFYKGLSSNDEQERVKNIFVRLTRLDENAKQEKERRNTRRRVKLEELVPAGENLNQIKELVKRLADEGARLVVTSQDLATGKEEVEIAHEALIQHWSSLQNWLEKDKLNLQLREKVTQAALEWKQHKGKEDYLSHRGELLNRAEALLRQPKFLNQIETDYVDACVKLRDRQSREQKRQIRVLLGLLITAVVTGGFAFIAFVYALYQLQQAQRQKVEQLAATAESLLATQSGEATFNAIASTIFSQDWFVQLPDRPPFLTTKSSLLNAIWEPKKINSFSHDTTVNSVAFSPDGQMIASSSEDKTVRLWNFRTGELIGKPLQHDSAVTSVAFSPDSKTIVTGTRNSRVHLWNAQTGKPIATLQHGTPSQLNESDRALLTLAGAFASAYGGHSNDVMKGINNDVMSVTFSPDGKMIASGSLDKTVRLWNAETKESIHTFHLDDGVRSVAFSPDGKTIVTGSNDGKVRLWSAQTEESIVTLQHGTRDGIAFDVAFSPDGQTIVSGSNDKTVRLWDAKTGKQIGKPLQHDVSAVAFSPNGKTIVTGSNDKTVRLWDAKTGKQIGKSLQHDEAIRSVAFSPDGQMIASGSGNTVRLWTVKTGGLVGEPLQHNETVRSVALSPNGQSIVTGNYDGTVRLWDTKTGKSVIISKPLQNDAVFDVAFSPDGKTIVTESKDNMVRLWDAKTGKSIGKPLQRDSKLFNFTFSPDGQIIATGSDDRTVRLWDTKTGEPIGKPLQHDIVFDVAFSLDGQTIAASSYKMVYLSNLKTGDSVGKPLQHNDFSSSVTFSPDGQTIVTRTIKGTMRSWDVKTQQPVGKPLTGLDNIDKAVTFSPDGQTIAAHSYKTVYLWNSRTGESIGKPLEHSARVSSVAFSPDGQTIATGSYDRTVRLWDVKTQQPVGKPLIGHSDIVYSVTFSRDGQTIATTSSHGTVLLWSASPESWLKIACEQLQYYPLLVKPTTNVARKAKQTCEPYWKEAANPHPPIASSLTPTPQASAPVSLPPSGQPFNEAVRHATQAAQLTQTSKTLEQWNTVASQWQQAITSMQAVPSTDPRYVTAQQKIGEYQKNLQYAQQQGELR